MQSPALACFACNAPHDGASRFCTQCGATLTGAGPVAAAAPFAFGCQTCGGDGARLEAHRVYCPTCRWLRPLGPNYQPPVEAFLWRLDADAMNTLSGIGPLNSAAHALPEGVGRPWFENAVNGVRLSEQQLPDIFALAIKAARIVGLDRLPEIYISGEQMWISVTMGSQTSSFTALGTCSPISAAMIFVLLGRQMDTPRRATRFGIRW